MMSARIKAVNLAVQHVGNPGQRMPVGRMDVGKSPDDSLGSQTQGNLGVFEDIFVIVKINELIMTCLPENDPYDCDKEHTDAQNHPMIARVR
jgi:hypothetical protein